MNTDIMPMAAKKITVGNAEPRVAAGRTTGSLLFDDKYIGTQVVTKGNTIGGD